MHLALVLSKIHEDFQQFKQFLRVAVIRNGLYRLGDAYKNLIQFTLNALVLILNKPTEQFNRHGPTLFMQHEIQTYLNNLINKVQHILF